MGFSKQCWWENYKNQNIFDELHKDSFCFFWHPCFPSSKSQFSVHMFNFQIKKIIFLQYRLKFGKLGFIEIAVCTRGKKYFMCLYIGITRPVRLTHSVLLCPKLKSVNPWLVVLILVRKTLKLMELLLNGDDRRRRVWQEKL